MCFLIRTRNVKIFDVGAFSARNVRTSGEKKPRILGEAKFCASQEAHNVFL